MRVNRIKQFEENVSALRTYFLSKARKSEATEYLQKYFGIKAYPDTTDGQISRTEIFWEDRAIDIDQDGIEVMEKGAKISLRCSVRGYVTVQLSPCATENLKCEEDGVILFHKLNPCWLSNGVLQYYLWQVFVAYSTVTAIDGNPSAISRCLVGAIRYFCTKIVGGIIVGTRVWHDLRIFLSIVFAVVSSSLFVYFLPSRNDEIIENLNSRTLEQSKRIDCLTLDLNKVDTHSAKLDSIVFYLKQIEKNSKKNGDKK